MTSNWFLVVVIVAMTTDTVSCNVIGDAIVNGLKEAFYGSLKALANAIKGSIVFAANQVKSILTSMADNVMNALTSVTKVTNEQLNKTLSSVLKDIELDHSGALIEMMHHGPLPIAYYNRRLDVDAALEHYDKMVSLTVQLGSIALVFPLVLSVIFAGIIAYTVRKEKKEKKI
jgi:hypothetical protein